MKPSFAPQVEAVRTAQEVATAAAHKAREAQEAHVGAVTKFGAMSPEALSTKAPLHAACAEALSAIDAVAQVTDPYSGSIDGALLSLGSAMQAVGIKDPYISDILQQFTVTIVQAQAKAAMRLENAPK